MEYKNETVAVCSLIKSYFLDPSSEELAEACMNKACPGDVYYGLTKEEILKLWNTKKEEGIQLHKKIETDYKNTCMNGYINNFLEKGYNKYDELTITLQTKKYLIKGKLDCLFIDHNNKRIIINEWKHCRFYYLKSNNKGFGPCSELYNTKFSKHILQVELYKKLIENKFQNYEIDCNVVYINNNKIEKIIKPTLIYIKAIENILNDLNN